MSEAELIKWFKTYTAITKKDNDIAETVGLELNVEISVEMAERLINIIEKQQKEIENSISKDKIRELIEELEDVLDLAEYDKTFAKYKKEALKEEINDLNELLGEQEYE